MRTEPELDVVDPLAAGREALSRGEWEQALAYFEAASERNHSAEAIEAVAMAAWWLDNAQLAIESREHAYRLYRERGDAAAAARMAIWLGWDSLAFRGEPAVARGWLQRAHRLLEGLDPVPEHGWLALREGEFTFLLENDIAATRRFAERARSIGTALAVPDIEFSALGLEGLALASQGNIADGIRLLDEASAAAMAGEMSELWAAGRTCCYMITACERVRDLQRAYQWSQRMLEFAKRWRIQDLFGVCRAHYGAILVLRGTWEEADATFETALRELRASRPGIAFEALVRRADLRRRQGGSGKRPSCSARSNSTPTPSSGSRMSHSIAGTRPLRRIVRRDSCAGSARRAGSSARPDSTCTLARSSHWARRNEQGTHATICRVS